MFKYFENSYDKIWDYRFEEAEKELLEYKDKIPRLALQYSQISMLRMHVTGDEEEKKEQKKRLENALQVLNKSNIDEMANLISKKNQEFLDNRGQVHEINPDILGLGELPKTEPLTIKNSPPVLTDIEELKKQLIMENKLMKGSITLWIGMTQLQRGSILKGAYNLRKAWGILYALYKEIQTNNIYHEDIVNSINGNVGIFFFILSIFPSAVYKILKVVGFVADREKGIELLKNVSSANSTASPMCIIILSINYMNHRALIPSNVLHEEFKPYLEFYLNKYPSNGIIRLLASQFTRNIGDNELSIKHIEFGIQRCKEINLNQVIFDYELAKSYFIQQNYEKAIDLYKNIVNTEKKLEFKPIAALELCSCLYLLNRESEITPIFNGIAKYIGKKSNIEKIVYPFYEYIKTNASKDEKLRNYLLGLVVFQFLYLRKDIAHIQNANAEKLLQCFEEIAQRYKTKLIDPIISIHVIRSQLQQLTGNDTFKKELEIAISHPDLKSLKQQVWLVCAYSELCEIEYANGDKTKALDLVTKALKYKGYPFEEIIKNRYDQAKKQITEELKK